MTLILHGIRYALAQGAQVALLGAALDPEIDGQFRLLQQETAANPDCRLELTYDETLAHLIYAGADLILIPSLYEPCGLAQMIAMKYGVVPIVRRVGGLADTVFDANYSTSPSRFAMAMSSTSRPSRLERSHGARLRSVAELPRLFSPAADQRDACRPLMGSTGTPVPGHLQPYPECTEPK